ncbi:hypothetical protein ATL17_1607 [Maritalea mobilis]|uniref:Helix-turn-helix protein n=1 Tax=Maritalea mobilis TaxID=483324 RepID=A0A4R6VN47_9HYPH|nr:hypothetical protein ATL17_1607 [Maritalea mobilis]
MSKPKIIRKHLFAMTQQEFADALQRTQPSVCEWEQRGEFPRGVLPSLRELGKEKFGRKWQDAWLFEPPKGAA